MVDVLSPDSYIQGTDSLGGLNIDSATMFADHKGVHKPRIEKKQRKLAEKVTFLKDFLEDGEQLLAVTTAVSPTSFLEQWTTGFIFVYIKRCMLVFTDRRVFHIPTTSGFDYRESVAEIRYGDLESIEQKGSRLKIAYKTGAKDLFLYVRGSERKKIRALLQTGSRHAAPAGTGNRTHLCPKCTHVLEVDRSDCPGCGKEFKSRTKARNLSLWLPGGGYFYTGHPFLGAMDALIELFFLVAIVGGLISGEWAVAGLFGALLALEKAITVYHANHFVKEFLPVEAVKIHKSPMRTVLGYVGMVFVLGFIGLGILGILSDTGVVPSERVLSADEISDGDYQILRDEGLVEQGEMVEYFYSEGLLSIKEGGSILTNYRVMAYEQDEDDAIIYYSIPNNELVSVNLIEQGTATSYSVYEVIGVGEENWIYLYLPHEYGDGERFANAVRAKIQQ
jgi:hypothetical protein